MLRSALRRRMGTFRGAHRSVCLHLNVELAVWRVFTRSAFQLCREGFSQRLPVTRYAQCLRELLVSVHPRFSLVVFVRRQLESAVFSTSSSIVCC